MKKYLLLLGLTIIASFLFSPNFSFAASTLVIDEFQIGKTGASNDEYIKIANYSSDSIKFDGFVLQKLTSTGSSPSNIYSFSKTANYYLERGKSIVVGNKDYSGPKDFTYSSAYISTDYTLYLKDASGNIIDFVGYGDCQDFDGQPIPEVKADDVWKRINGQDTDDNSVDFYNLNAPAAEILDPNTARLVITELYPNPKTGESEWLELYNPTGGKVSLSGLKICDGLGATHCYYFSKDDYIEAGYKTYDKTVTKITLNDSGDYLELRDGEDNVLAGTDIYEGADDGISFSAFGTEWKWTNRPTKGNENILEEIVETEEKTTKTVKPKTVKKSTKKSNQVVVDEEDASSVELAQAAGGEVKAAQTQSTKSQAAKSVITNKTVGWALVVLAIFGMVFYTMKEFKDKIYDFYHKIRRRNG